MQLSIYQQQILEAKTSRLDRPTPPKGMLIEALAGTGKSFILVEACKAAANRGITSSQVRLVVFGRKNKADLAAKLEEKVSEEWGQSASTLHSLSFQVMRDALRKPNSAFRINSGKYRGIAQQKRYIAKKEFGEIIQGSLWNHLANKAGAEINYESWDKDFLNLLELLRLYCFDPSLKDLRNQIFQLVELHKLEFPTDKDTINLVAGAAIDCLYDGYLAISNQLWLDYTDMSWGVWQHRRDWKNTIDSYKKQFRFLAVDECQDTDLLQLNVLSLFIDPSYNFLIAVGDRRQAVYAFRGCVSDGMDKFQEYFNCESFLLPINYRCGRLHLELVREVFPDIPIEAHENAIEGEIRIVRSDNFLQLFSDPTKSYMGVCRKNAPLIGCAIKLLAAGKPVKIKDRNLGKRVASQIEKICKSQRCKYNIDTFLQVVGDYENAERVRLAKEDNEQKLSDLNDLLQAIISLFEAYEPQKISDWQLLVDKIFDESDYKDAINLYSIHSGKGGEGDIAFIIAPEAMPMRHKNQSAEEAAQEKNLLYVALTRPREILAIITDDPAKISWLPRKYYEENKTVTVEVTHEPLEDDEIETLQELEAAEEDNLAMPSAVLYGEIEEELAKILSKLENYPRPKLRTILRELVDRLGKESIADLIG